MVKIQATIYCVTQELILKRKLAIVSMIFVTIISFINGKEELLRLNEFKTHIDQEQFRAKYRTHRQNGRTALSPNVARLKVHWDNGYCKHESFYLREICGQLV